MQNTKAEIGVIGLGVMGENLALNIEEKGFRVAVFNRSPERTERFLSNARGKSFLGTKTLKELSAALERPRRVLIMVKAGQPVDETLEALLPHLSEGDVVIDGGNEHFTNTERRSKALEERGLHFVGMGVSGGEEGARHGPSLMPGGSRAAYLSLEPVLTRIAAQVEDGACVTHIGPGGSGHFVKMVHNGIEYGDMQLIAESYDLLKHLSGLGNAELADTFEEWNRDELSSFLIEITARVFRKKDPESGSDLVDLILDSAGMKGTGGWTVQQASELAAPASVIAAAVEGRILSASLELRREGARILTGPRAAAAGDRRGSLPSTEVRQALYAAKLASYAQGLAMLTKASQAHAWSLRLGEIARIWKGGCIIRAKLLARIQESFSREGAPENLLFDPSFAEQLASRQESLRKTVCAAISAGVAVPALAAALSYYDGLRRERSPANLIQAQRDLFGAHSYQRIDRAGHFHTEW